MKLQDHINQSIREYPSLFKAENMDKSSILVLNHLFLINGNGYEWFDGYLAEHTQETPEPYGKIKSKPLLDTFFEMTKDMYKYQRITKSAFDLLDNDKEFNVVKRGNNYYSRYLCRPISCNYTPYPLCEYAKLNNIPDDIRQDWLDGAKKIAKVTLAFFTNRKAVENCPYYPSLKRIRSVTRDFERLTKEDRFIEVAVNLWGANASEEFKPELYARRHWKNHKRAQIRYLERFLARYVFLKQITKGGSVQNTAKHAPAKGREL